MAEWDQQSCFLKPLQQFGLSEVEILILTDITANNRKYIDT